MSERYETFPGAMEKESDIEGARDIASVEKSLRELIDVQCSPGNWNYDPYMHGMANGMILAMSQVDGRDPEFMDAPDEWLKDRTPEGYMAPTVVERG